MKTLASLSMIIALGIGGFLFAEHEYDRHNEPRIEIPTITWQEPTPSPCYDAVGNPCGSTYGDMEGDLPQ